MRPWPRRSAPWEPDAIFMAGGTLVMRDVNAGATATRIVRSTDPALADIRLAGDGVTIGAGVTMATIAAHRDLTFLAPVARAVGGPQIRNMATVGGNLFAPHPYGDFAVALLALGARVAFAGQGGAPRPLSRRSCATAAGRASSHPSRSRDRRRPADFGFLKASRDQAEGRLGAFGRSLPAAPGRAHPRRQGCLRRDGAHAAPGERRRARSRRPEPRCGHHRARRPGGCRRASIRRPTRLRPRGIGGRSPACTSDACSNGWRAADGKNTHRIRPQRIGAGLLRRARPEPARVPAPRRWRSHPQVWLRPGHLRHVHGRDRRRRRISPA